MRHLITIGIMFFFCIVELMAQSDFRNGYIINNYNDTVYGLLNYKGNKANTKKCIYREDINSENQIFTPDEIKGYRIANSKYYVSRLIKNGDETKKIFLEYLINGIVDIYYYRDFNGEHYLMDNGDDNLIELKNEEKEIIKNHNKYILETKEYIGILKSTFKESPLVCKRVENIELNHKSLINITRDYHNAVCADEECIIYEKNLPKFKSAFGIIAGLNALSISQTSKYSEKNYLENSQFGLEIFPSIGLYYKVNMPFVNEKLYFQYEGTYSRVDLSTSNIYIEPGSYTTYLNDISFSQNTFTNLGIIKYEFPKGKIRPTFQFGGFSKYFFETEYIRELKIKDSGGNTIITGQTDFYPFSKFDYGITCGAGLRRIFLNDKELFLDFRYQRGFGLLKSLNTNTFLFQFGFQIGK